MSKIWTLGDCHFGMRPIEYQRWLKMMINYFDNFFIPLLKSKVKDGDVLVQLGDIFDNRDMVQIDVLYEVDRIFSEISDILPVHIIVGNHDIFNKSTNDVNTSRVLRLIPNITLYETSTVVDLCGKKCLMMPWVERKKDQVEILKKYSGCDYLFCHSDLNGAKMHLSSVAHKNKDKIDVEDFGGYGGVYSGHIHIRQVTKNFVFVGAPYEMDRNDVGNQKGITVIDTISGDDSFIPNTLSPRFLKVSVLTESDIEKLEGLDTSRNYIDISISNSLLINNRKIRRKLEKILETGSFAEIDYVDDISESKEVLTREQVETEITNNSNLDLEDTINEYIKNKKYNTDDIKNGVVREYQNVIQLYKDNYKFKK